MEKNKTTLMYFMEKIIRMPTDSIPNFLRVIGLQYLISEREQILDAWNDGYEKGLRTREEKISNPAFDAETYYANNYDTTTGLPKEDSKRRAWHY